MTEYNVTFDYPHKYMMPPWNKHPGLLPTSNFWSLVDYAADYLNSFIDWWQTLSDDAAFMFSAKKPTPITWRDSFTTWEALRHQEQENRVHQRLAS